MGIEPSGRAATFQESSSPFNSFGRTAVVLSWLGYEERSMCKVIVPLAGSTV